MVNVQNNFVTKFLVEYAVKNSDQITKQNDVISSLGKNANTTATVFTRFAERLKEQGIQGKQATQVLEHFSNTYKKLGYDIRNVTKGSKQGIRLIDPKNIGKTISYTDAAKKTLSDWKEKMKPVQRGTQGWSIAQSNLQEKLKQFKKNSIDAAITTHRFMNNMKDSGYYVNRSGEFINKTTGRVEKLDKVAKTASRYSLKEFRASFLGIMFMAQRVSQTFGGMVSNVLQTVGIFDMLKGVLVGIIMPVLAPLIKEFLPKIMDWLKSPEHRKFLGNMILFLAVIAPIVSFVSQLSILFGSMGFGPLFLLGTKGLKGLQLFLGVLKNIASWFAIIFNAVGIITSLIKGDASGALVSVAGTVAGIVALLSGGIPAAIALAVSAVATLGKKVAVVRGIFMTLLLPIWKVANFILTLADMAKGTSWKEAREKQKSWDKIYTKNWLANLKGGFGKAVPMANGGVVTSPTLALIGEAGPEAVVPLNKSSSFNYSPTLNINGGGGMNNFEADRLAKKVNERLWFDARRFGV